MNTTISKSPTEQRAIPPLPQRTRQATCGLHSNCHRPIHFIKSVLRVISRIEPHRTASNRVDLPQRCEVTSLKWLNDIA